MHKPLHNAHNAVMLLRSHDADRRAFVFEDIEEQFFIGIAASDRRRDYGLTFYGRNRGSEHGMKPHDLCLGFEHCLYGRGLNRGEIAEKLVFVHYRRYLFDYLDCLVNRHGNNDDIAFCGKIAVGIEGIDARTDYLDAGSLEYTPEETAHASETADNADKDSVIIRG